MTNATKKLELSKEGIQKLADLAKIEISLQETENYLKDINNILGHLSSVNEANVSGVESTLNFYNTTRKDEPQNRSDNMNFDNEITMQNIPQKSKDNFVKVSKVINKNK